MEEQIKKGLCNFLGIKIEDVNEEMKTEKDLRQAFSNITGISRHKIKGWAHGFAYGVGKNFKRKK